MIVYNGQLWLLYFEMASTRLRRQTRWRDFFYFIHGDVFHSSIMEHGSIFFQPISFKLEQFVYMLV
jgi:hypothetical protein